MFQMVHSVTKLQGNKTLLVTHAWLFINIVQVFYHINEVLYGFELRCPRKFIILLLCITPHRSVSKIVERRRWLQYTA